MNVKISIQLINLKTSVCIVSTTSIVRNGTQLKKVIITVSVKNAKQTTKMLY